MNSGSRGATAPRKGDNQPAPIRQAARRIRRALAQAGKLFPPVVLALALRGDVSFEFRAHGLRAQGHIAIGLPDFSMQETCRSTEFPDDLGDRRETVYGKQHQDKGKCGRSVPGSASQRRRTFINASGRNAPAPPETECFQAVGVDRHHVA
jgi:hypothetical protein